MSRLLHRNRRWLTSTVLGWWVFALFVGIANACSWDGVTSLEHCPTLLTNATDAVDHDMAPGCDAFCSNDVRLVSVLKLVQDQPAGQPVIPTPHYKRGVVPISVHVLRLARNAHPPPALTFSLRTVRLTL